MLCQLSYRSIKRGNRTSCYGASLAKMIWSKLFLTFSFIGVDNIQNCNLMKGKCHVRQFLMTIERLDTIIGFVLNAILLVLFIFWDNIHGNHFLWISFRTYPLITAIGSNLVFIFTRSSSFAITSSMFL